MSVLRRIAAGVVGAAAVAVAVALAFFYVPAWVVTAEEVPDAAKREGLRDDAESAVG